MKLVQLLDWTLRVEGDVEELDGLLQASSSTQILP